MQALSDDDLNLAELSDDELVLAWDLWFDLAQTTNDDDPAYTHGVFQLAELRNGPVHDQTATVRAAGQPMN